MSLPSPFRRLAGLTGVVVLLAAACAGNTASPSAAGNGGTSSGAPAGSASPSTPSTGSKDSITLALKIDATSMDPYNAPDDLTGTSIDKLIFEGLVGQKVGEGGKVTYPGLLATTWEQVSPQVWRFHLRSNVTFQDGTLSSIGYHGVSVEGVNGFVFQGNAVKDVSNFMDLEVDSPCQGTTSGCYDLQGNPVGAAQWNVAVRGNVFTNGRGGEWIEEEQASCIPLKNLILDSNQLDATVNPGMTLFGSSTSGCAPDSGLQITDNTSTDPASQGGTPNVDISAFDFAHVTISGNNWLAFDGSAGYYPNTPTITALNLCGVVGGTITNNVWNNFGDSLLTTDCFGLPAGTPATSGLTSCNNTYGLTEPMAPTGATAPPAAPESDATC